MFVRWQSRKRTVHSSYLGGPDDVHWRARLVVSERVDGRPRQRHIAYLGGITESAIDNTHQRRGFWDTVHERLDRLANRVSTKDRQRIEITVALKVPRLSREEHEDSVARYLSLWPEGPPAEPKAYREVLKP
jgi:hypothetical protein